MKPPYFPDRRQFLTAGSALAAGLLTHERPFSYLRSDLSIGTELRRNSPSGDNEAWPR